MAVYKISEIAKKINISVHTLHYYDKIGLLPFVKRDDNGNRIFEDKDLHYLHIIDFLKKSDMSLKKIKEYIELSLQGDSTLKKRETLILEHKKEVELKISELKDILDAMDYKLWYYKVAVEAGTSKIFDNFKKNEIPKKMQKTIEKLNNVDCIKEFLKIEMSKDKEKK
ncbi:MerR family transcriptional regulator [Fusobacterium pseudoperiodonticum]|uniref:MerR family transcriptional regulator n=1 Tax=Fusobacterium pseudoperiodonticum TaxID=2663009 RepID=UPI0028EF8ACC|nr:MerR family transcriptional regulator [Fusobacterium pseudoperiodonticum]